MYITRRIVAILFVILFIISCKKTPTGSDTVIVTFPDANFETLIREVLEKPTGDIFDTDLISITELIGNKREIAEISGVEYCVNLVKIELMENSISDISKLSHLTNITDLNFFKNQIIDISPISGLTNLTNVRFNTNQVSDISVLMNLTNLTGLFIGDNQISDINALANLTNLTKLYLYDNQISNISTLTNLTKLIKLYLSGNQISNIKAIVDNSGIDSGDEIWLSRNPLSDTSKNTYIPQLEARGVTVYQ